MSSQALMNMALGSSGNRNTLFSTVVGVAAADLPENSITLSVSVPEFTPAMSGELMEDTQSETVTLKDREGNDVQSTSTASTYITAEWFGFRFFKYPPTVRKGERVLLLKIANTDQYYWFSLGRDHDIMQLDTFRIEVSDIKDPHDPTVLTDENTYFFEIDTKTGKVQLKTCKKTNGEEYGYAVVIDTVQQKLSINDDSGNTIVINSTEPQILMTNRDGASVDLIKKSVIISAPLDIFLNAGRRIYMKSPSIGGRAKASDWDHLPPGAGGVSKWETDYSYNEAEHLIENKSNNTIINSAPCMGFTGDSKFLGDLIGKYICAENYESTPDMKPQYKGAQFTDTTFDDEDYGNVSAQFDTNDPTKIDDITDKTERHGTNYEEARHLYRLTFEAFEELRNNGAGVSKHLPMPSFFESLKAHRLKTSEREPNDPQIPG